MKGKIPRRTGVIIEPDDMDVGQFYTVHSTKIGSDHSLPIAGMAFRLTAMNLPFCIGKPPGKLFHLGYPTAQDG